LPIFRKKSKAWRHDVWVLGREGTSESAGETVLVYHAGTENTEAPRFIIHCKLK